MLKNVSVEYGVFHRQKKEIIKNLSLSIGQSDRIILYGNNGVGKTTFVRAICGQLPFSEGKIIWKGENLTNDLSLRRLKSSGNFEAGKMLYHYANLKDNLVLQDALFKANKLEAQSIPKAIICNDEWMDRPIATMSLGQRHRSAIYCALRKPVDLYFFDEPDNGLDRETINTFSSIINSALFEKKIFIMSTHDSVLIHNLANFVLFMNKDGQYILKKRTELPENLDDLDSYLLKWMTNNCIEKKES